MEFKLVESGISSEDIKFLANIASDKLDKPALIESILSIISDESPYINHIGTNKVFSLFRLMKEYFNNCWSIYLDAILGGDSLDKYIIFCNKKIYYVLASNGERVATVSEIENGVKNLVAKFEPVVDVDTQEKLNLLMWTFTGQIRYYKSAGLIYHYENDKLVETPYELIAQAGKKLRELVDWTSTRSNYEKALALLKMAKRRRKYKYPQYAKDEIFEEISSKQIIFLCRQSLNSGVVTDAQEAARKLVFKIDKYNYKPLPEDIAIMRTAYDECLLGLVDNPYKKLGERISAICEKIEDAGNKGFISKSHFAFKVLDTIKIHGKCSEKQLGILKNAEIEIDRVMINRVRHSKSLVAKQVNNEENIEDKDIINELMEMSEALGFGGLKEV